MIPMCREWWQIVLGKCLIWAYFSESCSFRERDAKMVQREEPKQEQAQEIESTSTPTITTIGNVRENHHVR